MEPVSIVVGCKIILTVVCKLVVTHAAYKYYKAKRQLCELRLTRHKSATNKLVE
jgi:hypothetical protein